MRIKPIAYQRSNEKEYVYFLQLDEPKHSQLFLLSNDHQKEKALAVYEHNNKRFEDVTILYEKDFLNQIYNQLLTKAGLQLEALDEKIEFFG